MGRLEHDYFCQGRCMGVHGGNHVAAVIFHAESAQEAVSAMADSHTSHRRISNTPSLHVT